MLLHTPTTDELAALTRPQLSQFLRTVVLYVLVVRVDESSYLNITTAYTLCTM